MDKHTSDLSFRKCEEPAKIMELLKNNQVIGAIFKTDENGLFICDLKISSHKVVIYKMKGALNKVMDRLLGFSQMKDVISSLKKANFDFQLVQIDN